MVDIIVNNISWIVSQSWEERSVLRTLDDENRQVIGDTFIRSSTRLRIPPRPSLDHDQRPDREHEFWTWP